MKLLLTVTWLFLATLPGMAQRVIDVDAADGTGATDKLMKDAVYGQLYDGLKYVRITAGTPFFKEQFMKAQLFDNTGARYISNAVRINLMDNQVNFLTSDGHELVATSPVRRVILTDSVTGDKYYFVLGEELNPGDKSLNGTWLQVLVNDETSLCHQMHKTIHEPPSYGTATVDQDILTIDVWFLRINGQLVRFKNWQELQTQLADKKEALDQCIHDHHLKGKSSDDYVQLVQCYNTAKREKKT
jgi:hypothetical protein